MTKQEFAALVADKLSVTNPGDVTAAKIKQVFDALTGVIFDEIKAVNHVEAGIGSLVADVATDIPFATPFANTSYAIAYRALDGQQQKVDCAIVKHTDHLTVTPAESDVSFEFIAATATILVNPT